LPAKLRLATKVIPEYYEMLVSGQSPEEVRTMVDLLTTNETYFFREPKHFEFLRDEIIAWR
jgi:chemotaxis protein methyltransferase CheR